MRREEGAGGRRPVGVLIGGLGAIAISIALVPVRSHIDNANLALILVLVVVCAALVGGNTSCTTRAR